MIINCPLYMGVVVYHAKSTLPVPVPVRRTVFVYLPTFIPTYLPTYLHTCTYCKQIHKKNLWASIVFHQLLLINIKLFVIGNIFSVFICLFLVFVCYVWFASPLDVQLYVFAFCLNVFAHFAKQHLSLAHAPQYAPRGSNIHSLSRIFHLHTVPCIYL